MDGEIADVHNNCAHHLESDSEFQQNLLSKDSEKCMISLRNFNIPKFYFLSFRGKALYVSKNLTIQNNRLFYKHNRNSGGKSDEVLYIINMR